MKKLYILFLASILITPFIFTSCNEELDVPPIDTVEDWELLTIADIYQIYADSGDLYTFKDNYILYATVTMDDKEGNIYKEAYVQDTSGGIDIYKLSYAETVKVGQYLRFNLNGSYIKNYSGKMEIVYDSIIDTDKSIIVQLEDAPIEPVKVTIEDIESGEYDCELVEIQNIQFKDDELNRTYYYPLASNYDEPNRYAIDSVGNEIIIRTSEYADFASDTIPNGSGNIVAIVTKYIKNDEPIWQLLIRSIDEVKMNSSRF